MGNFLENFKSYIKKIDAVINEYTSKTKSVSNPSFSYVEWAMKLMDEGKEDIAIEKLETATQMAIPNPEACVNLAMTYLKRGEENKVPALLKKAIEIDSQYARAYMAYGIYYTTVKDSAKAEHYYEIAAKLDPRLPDVYVNWAVALIGQGKRKDAQEKFQKALFYNRHNIVGLYLWAILDIEMELYDTAKAKLEEVLSFQPNNSEAAFYMAFIFYKQKNYEIATRYARMSLELNDNNPQVYGLLADSYAMMNDYKTALTVYTKADAKHFNHEKLYISWGHNAFANHDFENSLRAYKKALKASGKSVEAKMGLALNYMVIKEYSQAKELFLDILDESSNKSEILINLSNIASFEQDYKQSAYYMEQAIKADVKKTEYYFSLGQKYEIIGDNEKAKDAYLKMLEYDKDNTDACYHYAKLIWDDNPKEALRKARTAYNADKENEKYIKLYANMLFLNGQYKNSLDIVNKYLEKTTDESKLLYLKIKNLLSLNRYEDSIEILYALPQEKKDNEDFDYFLLWAYIIRANTTNLQGYINEMNDFSYYLSQKYSQNNNFMIKLKELNELKNKKED